MVRTMCERARRGATSLRKEAPFSEQIGGTTFCRYTKLMEVFMYTALTIAGSDPSGGAGIQADIKTMTALGVYATCCICALTAQNTTGVTGIMEVEEDFVGKQLDSVFCDIMPNAVKIGMLSSSGIMEVVREKLDIYHAENVVVDPVMVATSGHKLMADDAITTLKDKLLKEGTVTTPNIPEAEILSDMSIASADDMVNAAKKIYDRFGCTVLIKGGHGIDATARDYLYGDGISRWYETRRVDTNNTHGTGCTLSSAIASHLAKGEDIETAVEHAKAYIQGALEAGLNLGKGNGPLSHMWNM